MDGSSGQTSEQNRPTFLRTPRDCYVKGSEVIDSAIVEGRLAVSKTLNWQIRQFNFRFRQFLQLSSMLRSNDPNFKIAYFIWKTDRR